LADPRGPLLHERLYLHQLWVLLQACPERLLVRCARVLSLHKEPGELACLPGPRHGRGSTWRRATACPESPADRSHAIGGRDKEHCCGTSRPRRPGLLGTDQAVPSAMWGRAAPRGWQGSAPRDAVSLALLSDTRAVPVAWSPGTLEVISEDDRSPPDRRPPRYDDPGPATRVPLVDTFALRPAVGASCGWNRASTRSWSTEPLSKCASQVVRLPQAA
jgi:hypothetical protein